MVSTAAGKLSNAFCSPPFPIWGLRGTVVQGSQSDETDSTMSVGCVDTRHMRSAEAMALSAQSDDLINSC